MELSEAPAALPAPPEGRRGWPWTAEPAASGPPPPGGWPRISVVTPSYNQGAYLEATLRSVLLQEYPALEYLVLDGASSDDSPAIICRYERHLAWWCSAPDRGQADAIATGLDRATGTIACWLNSDDILLPGALHHVARLFSTRARADVVYGNRLVIDAEGAVMDCHVWPAWLTRYHWANGQPLAQECSFWRSELYRRVGGLDRDRYFTMDHDLFYRMWRAGRFHKTTALLGCLRVHEETKNTRDQDVRMRELADARSRYGLVEAGPLRARLLARMDRFSVSHERARMGSVSQGSDPGEYGPGAAR